MTIARSLSVTHPFEHEGVAYDLRTLPNRILLALPGLDEQAQIELLVRAGIANWKGLKHASGEEVPCEQGSAAIGGVTMEKALTMEGFDQMPFTHIPVVSQEIIRVNQLSDDDVKN